MSLVRGVTFVLEGPNQGRTLQVGRYRFTRGRLTLALEASQIASTESLLKRWGARLLTEDEEQEAPKEEVNEATAESKIGVPEVDRKVSTGRRSSKGKAKSRKRNARSDARNKGRGTAADDGRGTADRKADGDRDPQTVLKPRATPPEATATVTPTADDLL